MIILIFSSFLSENSFEYKNYIFTGNVYTQIDIRNKLLTLSSAWNGKRNLISNSYEENSHIKSQINTDFINLITNFYNLKNNTLNNLFSLRREYLAFKKEINFFGFICSEEIGVEFEKYFSEINDNSTTYNNGMVFYSNIYKKYNALNFSISAFIPSSKNKSLL